jgi:hypothetical protein
MKKLFISLATISAIILSSCCGNKEKEETTKTEMQQLVESYAPVKLTTDLSILSEKERAMLPILIQISEIMDELFWQQSFGDKSVLDTISDQYIREFAMIQYGAWNRLDCEKTFVPGFGEKPKGANFYPTDMTKEEFEALQDPAKESLYTIIRRDENGALKVIPYREAYAEKLAVVDSLLGEAIALAEDAGLKNYLEKVATREREEQEKVLTEFAKILMLSEDEINAIMNKTRDKIDLATYFFNQNALNAEEYTTIIKHLAEQTNKEISKINLEKFKDSSLYIASMGNLAAYSKDQLRDMIKQIEDLIAKNAKAMGVEELKAYQERTARGIESSKYSKALTDMASKQPEYAKLLEQEKDM